MGEEQRSKRLLQVIALIGAAVLLLAGVLTLVAGGFVREQLIRPLLFFLQVIGLYLQAIPQLGIWFFLLLLLVLAGTYALRGLHRRARPRRREELKEEVPPPPGPISDLAKRIGLGREGEYFKWRVRRELRDFLIDLISWQREISREEASELVRSGAWTDDPKAREFFRRGFERRYTLLAQLGEFLNSLLGRRDEGCLQELAAVVGYLEEFASGKVGH